jgi:hypothetical protein
MKSLWSGTSRIGKLGKFYSSSTRTPGSRETNTRRVQPRHEPANGEFVQSCGQAMTWAQLLGAANERKEGDEIVGLAASSDSVRMQARDWLARVTIQV